MKKRKVVMATELLAQLERDPVFVEQRQRREEAVADAEADDRRAQTRLLHELEHVGLRVTSVWELVERGQSASAQAIPILFAHLQEPYNDTIREGIARALAVECAAPIWHVLRRSFQAESSDRVKDGLAIALANSVDDRSLPDLVALLRNSSLGSSRILLLGALERRLPATRSVLMALGADPVLAREIQEIFRRWRRRSKPSS